LYATYQTVHGSLVRLFGLFEFGLEDILVGLLRARPSRGGSGSGSGSGLGSHCVGGMKFRGFPMKRGPIRDYRSLLLQNGKRKRDGLEKVARMRN
jgi:hypothetical protein